MVKESIKVRRNRLKKLGRLHGFFLLFFSGVSAKSARWNPTAVLTIVVIQAEFTLTFLSKFRPEVT